MTSKYTLELADSSTLLQDTLERAGGIENVLTALQEARDKPIVAEALSPQGDFANVAEALIAVSEAQQAESIGSVAEAVETAGGPFVIAEALRSAGGNVAEAIEAAGGTLAIAEALASPHRAFINSTF